MKNLSKASEHLSSEEDRIQKETIASSNESTPSEVVLESVVTFSLLEHETNESQIYTLKLVNHPKEFGTELSLDSPIGQKIYKTHVGDVVTYTLMSNDFTATILKIETPA